jgi:hypothetical protein
MGLSQARKKKLSRGKAYPKKENDVVIYCNEKEFKAIKNLLVFVKKV